MNLRIITILLITLFSPLSLAKYNVTYEVTITNLTRGQTFTPQLLVTHNKRVELFEAGQLASTEISILAESGNTQPLTDTLSALGNDVAEIKTQGGLLAPGGSVVTTIKLAHPSIGF